MAIQKAFRKLTLSDERRSCCHHKQQAKGLRLQKDTKRIRKKMIAAPIMYPVLGKA